MKMLLVVFIVLINYNEFSYQLPTLSFDIRDINVHIHGAGMEAQHGADHGDHVDHVKHGDHVDHIDHADDVHPDDNSQGQDYQRDSSHPCEPWPGCWDPGFWIRDSKKPGGKKGK